MDNPGGRRPSTVHAPEAHVPLRRASAQQLRSRQSAPRPLFDPSTVPAAHQVRGFNPSPVQQAVSGVAEVTASNEHAFAGRNENRRRPFNLPLGRSAATLAAAPKPGEEILVVDKQNIIPSSRPPSSPAVPSPTSPIAKHKSLRSHRSFGDGLKGLRHRFSQNDRNRQSPRESSVPPPPSMPSAEVRDSFRSVMTSTSSFLNTNSVYTDHSSLTGRSSGSDFATVFPTWPSTRESLRSSEATATDTRPTSLTVDDTTRPASMTVEDAIGMYEEGFDSTRASLDTHRDKSPPGSRSSERGLTKFSTRDSGSTMQDHRPASQPTEQDAISAQKKLGHRRSQSATHLLQAQGLQEGRLKPGRTPSQQKRTFSQILAPRANKVTRPTSKASVDFSGARDRYGFKKASHYVTVEEYDVWNAEYSHHLDRRTSKWQELMDAYGLNTDKPFRFPPKSDKIKRYVRKGIPPDLRGAAWFWYAGGPSKLAKERGLYFSLLDQVRDGKLSDNDREHIERDLNRTFPDNIRFKPDPTTTLDAQSGAGGGGESNEESQSHSNAPDPETPILCSLRRVLQAFAVHNPDIGYCQSLNFIAGLLLLFLDEDEEKAFILLQIITSTHLPGTHGVALEGANIDIAVLMSCIKETLPLTWAKLDDKNHANTAPFPGPQALRLPTISLATTAWFMSLFVGTLPIESVLRVWDCLFFEGSKTLFRIALAIFKVAEPQITAVVDPMEVFQLVQSIPRSMLDVNSLLELCFRRRGGFAHVSQEIIERRRADRRVAVQEGLAGLDEEGLKGWKKWRAKTRG